MTRGSARIVSFAVASLAVAPCRAQTVQGILVEEKSRLPIGNARVALIDSLGHVVAQAITDTGLAGAFYLTAGAPGRYEVRIVVGRGGVSRSPRFSLDSNQVMEKTFVAPDMSTFEVVESEDRLFSQAVRDAVAQSRYAPAERDGVAVAQVFDFAVDFGVGDAPPKIHDKNAMIVRALGITMRRSSPNH
jgi:hypothetical protein